MLDFVIKYYVLLGAGLAFVFTAIGLVFRRSPAARHDRDNLIFADRYQGLTIASLIVVAFMIYYIDDPRAVVLLREQASLVATFSILGSVQIIDRFRRSLK